MLQFFLAFLVALRASIRARADAALEILATAGLKARRTSVGSPWQNGLAERWIKSCRREILDHVIALNEEHLCRILREYVRYHRVDRLHDALAKEAPIRRAVEQRPDVNAKVISIGKLGGLHHRYGWRQAA
jgi:putative transposase